MTTDTGVPPHIETACQIKLIQDSLIELIAQSKSHEENQAQRDKQLKEELVAACQDAIEANVISKGNITAKSVSDIIEKQHQDASNKKLTETFSAMLARLPTFPAGLAPPNPQPVNRTPQGGGLLVVGGEQQDQGTYFYNGKFWSVLEGFQFPRKPNLPQALRFWLPKGQMATTNPNSLECLHSQIATSHVSRKNVLSPNSSLNAVMASSKFLSFIFADPIFRSWPSSLAREDDLLLFKPSLASIMESWCVITSPLASLRWSNDAIPITGKKRLRRCRPLLARRQPFACVKKIPNLNRLNSILGCMRRTEAHTSCIFRFRKGPTPPYRSTNASVPTEDDDSAGFVGTANIFQEEQEEEEWSSSTTAGSLQQTGPTPPYHSTNASVPTEDDDSAGFVGTADIFQEEQEEEESSSTTVGSLQQTGPTPPYRSANASVPTEDDDSAGFVGTANIFQEEQEEEESSSTTAGSLQQTGPTPPYRSTNASVPTEDDDSAVSYARNCR
eukprot:scaffold2327_cov96-Cylindrotheca_fusiformis.AAC.4